MLSFATCLPILAVMWLYISKKMLQDMNIMRLLKAMQQTQGSYEAPEAALIGRSRKKQSWKEI